MNFNHHIPKLRGAAALEIDAGEWEEPDTVEESGVRFFITVIEADGRRMGLADFGDYYAAVKFATETAKEFGIVEIIDSGREAALAESGGNSTGSPVESWSRSPPAGIPETIPPHSQDKGREIDAVADDARARREFRK